MQGDNTETPTSSATRRDSTVTQTLRVRAPPGDNSRLLLRLAGGTAIITDNLLITNTSLSIVAPPSVQVKKSVSCLHLVPPTVIDTAGYASAQSKENDNDSFTTLATLSERPVNYELAVRCPLENCLKFGPVNDLTNHYMLAHANHDPPDSDEEIENK